MRQVLPDLLLHKACAAIGFSAMLQEKYTKPEEFPACFSNIDANR
jgi:hypothetical protein